MFSLTSTTSLSFFLQALTKATTLKTSEDPLHISWYTSPAPSPTADLVVPSAADTTSEVEINASKEDLLYDDDDDEEIERYVG